MCHHSLIRLATTPHKKRIQNTQTRKKTKTKNCTHILQPTKTSFSERGAPRYTKATTTGPVSRHFVFLQHDATLSPTPQSQTVERERIATVSSRNANYIHRLATFASFTKGPRRRGSTVLIKTHVNTRREEAFLKERQGSFKLPP